MLLNGVERLVLLNSVLPPESSLLTMKLMHDLRDELGLSESDFDEIGVEDPSAPIGWVQLKILADKEVEVGIVLNSEIVAALKGLDEKKKVTPQHVSLFEKFGVSGG